MTTQRNEAFTYQEVGATRDQFPTGYDADYNRVQLGSGRAVYDRAVEAISRWEMFPDGWTRIMPAETPIREGNVVAMMIHAFGLWWVNGCRIVYVLDEDTPIRRFGFAYGTLPAHVEQGEERFSVEFHDDERVWYDLRAFSRPRHWFVRMGYPVARILQRRFVTASQQAMLAAVERSHE